MRISASFVCSCILFVAVLSGSFVALAYGDSCLHECGVEYRECRELCWDLHHDNHPAYIACTEDCVDERDWCQSQC